MNWVFAGWIVIGFSVLLLVVLAIVFKRNLRYQSRRVREIEAMVDSQVISVERGMNRHIILGDQLWSWLYPGLGLHPLSTLPNLLNPEIAADGRLTISTSDGSLAVFARQIVNQSYQDGYSPFFENRGVTTTLPGSSPLAFTAGLLPEIGKHSQGMLLFLGQYGPESALWAEALRGQDRFLVAAAGTLEAQAALFSQVRNLILGEMVFMLPRNAANSASLLTEDILRILLMLGLVLGAILKLVGVL
jgi:hypothetical protein